MVSRLRRIALDSITTAPIITLWQSPRRRGGRKRCVVECAGGWAHAHDDVLANLPKLGTLTRKKVTAFADVPPFPRDNETLKRPMDDLGWADSRAGNTLYGWARGDPEESGDSHLLSATLSGGSGEEAALKHCVDDSRLSGNDKHVKYCRHLRPTGLYGSIRRWSPIDSATLRRNPR